MNATRTSPEHVVAAGRYRIHSGGSVCGEESWRVVLDGDRYVVSGEQIVDAPHPFPSRQEWRATLTREWRLTGLEIHWHVGPRRLAAVHEAADGRWRVRIEAEGHVREQHGDFPDFAEVEYGTPLFNTFILARRDFQQGGEHEFPVLRIGPPLMAVQPERMLYRCVEQGVVITPRGPVDAKRYVVSLPPAPEHEGYTFWADADGFVLESYEGHDPSRPWMKLVEFARG